MPIDQFSVSALYLETFFNDQKLSNATGFTYLKDGQHYFVTNWHVVSGRNPSDGQPLADNGGVPNRIEFYIHAKNNIGSWTALQKPLIDSVTDQPLWYEHPEKGQEIDVVILPITIPDGHTFYPINNLPNIEDMRVFPGVDVFIIGFPLGITGGGAFPIWKKGTIASEPDVNLDNLPKVYLDTATREGMSGSPIILRSIGSYLRENGINQIGGGISNKFFGIYSSRIGANDEFKAHLGVAWKKNVIEEIIDGKKIGEIRIS